MARRFLGGLCAVLLLVILCASGLAELNLYGVQARPNRSLEFRAGPGTEYPAICVVPEGTPVVAIETESDGGDAWVLCEFKQDGQRVRGYAESGGISLSGDIPRADHDPLERRLVNAGDVLAAPDLNAAVRATLAEGDAVTFLGFEGAYCLVEYRQGGPARGYLREEAFWVDLGEFEEDFPDYSGGSLYAIKETVPMYAEPDENSALLFQIPFDASVTVLWSESDDAPGDWQSIFYGGLHGYGRFYDFSDLRFETPEGARATLTMMGEYQD